jgi:arginine decarboxylase
VFSKQILSFMRSLDTPEIHGYRAECGYRVYLDKALEIAATARPAPTQDPEGHPGPAAAPTTEDP